PTPRLASTACACRVAQLVDAGSALFGLGGGVPTRGTIRAARPYTLLPARPCAAQCTRGIVRAASAVSLCPYEACAVHGAKRATPSSPPSPLNATARTPPACPTSVPTSCPRAASHVGMALSPPPLATTDPSLLSATPQIPPVWPRNVARGSQRSTSHSRTVP